MPSLAAVGDLMLGDTAAAPGFGFASRLAERPLKDVFQDAAFLLRDSEIVFGNLEVVLSSLGYEPRRLGSRHMRGHPRFARELRDLGFTVLNLANNHANQHGVDAFNDTRRLLEEAGIAVCGVRGTPPWCSKPVVQIVASQRVGWLGYCLHPRQYYPDRQPPFAEGTRDEILGDIRRLRAEVDSLCVSVHWGEEFVMTASDEEAALARAMVAAGATAVLGHHPHVVREARLEDSAVIALSLGNFVSDLTWHDDVREGVVLRCRLEGGTASALELSRTTVMADYGVRRDGRPSRALERRPLLDQEGYRSEARRRGAVMRRRRILHLLRNLHRANLRLLTQWAARTVLNRIGGYKPKPLRPLPGGR